MRRAITRTAIVGSALTVSMALFVPAASAHPSGMCHVAGTSGVVVYFPPGAAADAHHRLLNRGIHPHDYPASAADRQDFLATGNRKCAESRVNPTG